MEPGDLYLGYKGYEIKLPTEGRELTPDYIESVRSGETASGRYVEDIRWLKKKWTIEYSVMKGQFLENMVALYEARTFLNFIEVDRFGNPKHYDVKMTLIPPARIKIIGPWYWEGGAIELRQVRTI